MSVLGYTGQVNGQVKDQVAPQVGGQIESRSEWFSKGGRTFLSANKKLMAGWKTRPPVIDLSAVSCSVALAKVQASAKAEILEKIGV
jgi:hypothetical protein